jgi:cadmium resistance protein CadD (predicted permease)
MDLFIALCVNEIAVTIVLAALFGFKNFEFYRIWFGAISGAMALIGFGWYFACDFMSMPNSNQMAFIGLFAINLALWFVASPFAAAKASETLRKRVSIR